jgi:hypothetical protein
MALLSSLLPASPCSQGTADYLDPLFTLVYQVIVEFAVILGVDATSEFPIRVDPPCATDTMREEMTLGDEE